MENVAEVISDRKIQVPNGGNTATDYYIADVKSYSDFYAFHSLKPGRNFTSDDYRYSVNGQEKETEITGTASHSSAEYWMYDSRIGRRWENDPVRYAGQSPYACFNNNPVYFVDIRGLEGENKDANPTMTDQQRSDSEEAITLDEVVCFEKRTLKDRIKGFFRDIQKNYDEKIQQWKTAMKNKNPKMLPGGTFPYFKQPDLTGNMASGSIGVDLVVATVSVGNPHVIMNYADGWWTMYATVNTPTVTQGVSVGTNIAEYGTGDFEINKTYWDKNRSNDLRKYVTGNLSIAGATVIFGYASYTITSPKNTSVEISTASIWRATIGIEVGGEKSMVEGEAWGETMSMEDSAVRAASQWEEYGGDFGNFMIRHYGIDFMRIADSINKANGH